MTRVWVQGFVKENLLSLLGLHRHEGLAVLGSSDLEVGGFVLKALGDFKLQAPKAATC